jgi:hypothetical protein
MEKAFAARTKAEHELHELERDLDFIDDVIDYRFSVSRTRSFRKYCIRV